MPLPPEPPVAAPTEGAAAAQPRGEEIADALAEAVERLRRRAAADAAAGQPQTAVGAAPHKHSMSLIGRWRRRRKQRRER
jgi:hypothetical protein